MPTVRWTALLLMHLAQWFPGSTLAACVNRAINDRPAHTAGRHLLSVVQAATNSKRLLANGHRLQWTNPLSLPDIILYICT